MPRPTFVRRLTLAAAALLLAAASLFACAPRAGGPLVGHTRAIPKQVGNLSMAEARTGLPDTTFSFRARPGGLLFVFFGFTHCPDLCPTTLGDLRRALRKAGPDGSRVEVAFVTVDPGRDSSETMARYLGSFFVGGHPLRPDTNEQLLAVQAAFGAASSVTRKANGDFDVAHTAVGYLVDERGAVVLEWDYGTTPADMAHDLRILLSRTPGGSR
jgi:protein SCO1/2